MRHAIKALATAVLVAALGISTAMSAERRGGYAEVNGLRMYYEVQGEGRPVMVIHGAYMSTGLMAPVIEGLAETRQVIAMDLQAHGRTGDVDRPITYEQMADDVAALMRAVGVAEADVFGYSMGGGVALQLAIRHPERVRRMVVASAAYKHEGAYPELYEMIEGMTAESFAGTPFEAEYRRLAPNPDAFPTLVEKLVALDTTPFDWPAEDIAAPTLVISGDADIILPEHAVEMFRVLGGGPSEDFMSAPADELAILPGTTHLGVIEQADLVVPMVARFLDKEVGE